MDRIVLCLERDSGEFESVSVTYAIHGSRDAGADELVPPTWPEIEVIATRPELSVSELGRAIEAVLAVL